MSRPPRHARAFDWMHALCGAQYLSARVLRVNWKTTAERNKVTCRACLARLAVEASA